MFWPLTLFPVFKKSATGNLLFNAQDEQDIIACIEEAEKITSAEIRVHISQQKGTRDVLAEAKKIFNKLGMHKTAERNGILIFFVPNSKQFAVLGDSGINSKVPEGYWNNLKDEMQQHFQSEAFKLGIIHGINAVGLLLSAHFKPLEINPNELSNQISQD